MKIETLFAVTDYFCIFTLKVVSEHKSTHATQLITEVLDPDNLLTQQDIEYHNNLFKKIFIHNVDGKIVKNTVFYTYEEAKLFAETHIENRLKKINEEADHLNHILKNI